MIGLVGCIEGVLTMAHMPCIHYGPIPPHNPEALVAGAQPGWRSSAEGAEPGWLLLPLLSIWAYDQTHIYI